MFPRTRVLLPFAALLALSACGSPPTPMPTDPPYVPPSSSGVTGSAPAFPTAPVTVYSPVPIATTLPPIEPTIPTTAATGPATGPATVPATPTPSHAAKCTGSPTGAQILALIKGKPGIPDQPLKVQDGPYCESGWSFTAVVLTDEDTDPLGVLATGSGSTLALLGAGSDVCGTNVQAGAPPGIRVMACGY